MGDTVAVITAGGNGSSRSWAGWAVRVHLRLVPLFVALLAAALTVAAVLGLPSQALAADAPEGLGDMVTRTAQEHATGSVEWARYVATTRDEAAGLLCKSPDELYEGLPERVYLVVMHGDFGLSSPMPPPDVTEGAREEQGPYLAFLYWRAGDSWGASDFTVLQDPVPMDTAGVPQTIEPFALAHPILGRAWEYALAGLFLFLPTVLLVASAVLVARKRHRRWSLAPAAGVAIAVAAWQTYVMLRSVAGQSWDPSFHGVKLGVLVVVVSVDLAAALVLLRTWSRLGTGGQRRADGAGWFRAGIWLLVVAAVLSVVSLPLLVTTGE